MKKKNTKITRLNAIDSISSHTLEHIIAQKLIEHQNEHSPNDPSGMFDCGVLGICVLEWRKNKWEYRWYKRSQKDPFVKGIME